MTVCDAPARDETNSMERRALLQESVRACDHSPLSRLLAWDVRSSARFYAWYQDSPYLPHWLLLVLEASGHGLIWIIWPPVLFALRPQLPPATLAVLLNFYFVTLLDLVVICIMKPVFHRSRPPYNAGLQAATVEAVDQFSFPSGHATRAVSVAAFVVYAANARPGALPGWMESFPFLVFVIAWGLAVTVSRVALGRHHVLDVFVGALVGLAYIAAVDRFWVPEASIVAIRDSLFPTMMRCKPADSETCGLPLK
jgi:presqualene diphosphate phosphatase